MQMPFLPFYGRRGVSETQTPFGNGISNRGNTRRARLSGEFEHHGHSGAAIPRYNISPTTTRGGRTVYVFPGNTNPVPKGPGRNTRATNHGTPAYGNMNDGRGRRRARAPEAGRAQGERRQPTRVNTFATSSDDSESSGSEDPGSSPDPGRRSDFRKAFDSRTRWEDSSSEGDTEDTSQEEGYGKGKNHKAYSSSGEETVRDSTNRREEKAKHRGRERRRRQRNRNRRTSSSPDPRDRHNRASEPNQDEEEPPEDYYAVLGLARNATPDE